MIPPVSQCPSCGAGLSIVLAYPRNDNVRERRKALGLTQEKFAKAAGLSQGMLSRMESGLVPVPDAVWGTLDRLEAK